jgi:hypothetical protein
MDPFTLTGILVLAVSGVLVVAAWPWLCHFCQTTLIPLVRDRVGAGAAKLLTDLVVFLDQRATPTRATLQRAWKAFQKHVLGVKTTYAKTGPSTATAKTEMFVRAEESKVYRLVEEQELGWDDIPDEIRRAMIQKNKQAGVVDQKKVFEQRLSQRAEEEQMLDLIQ